MRSPIRRKLEMAARVREFCQAHISTEPGFAPVLARLEATLVRGTAIDARQQQGFMASRVARGRRRELRRLIHFQLVRYVVALGAYATRAQAGESKRFKIPNSSLPNAAFVTAVRGLIGDATQHQEELVALGMAPALLDELTLQVGEFETAAEAGRTARRDHIGAREELEEVNASISGEVRAIDGIVGYSFGNNRDIMAEWRAAKRIPGPRKGNNGNVGETKAA